jgi:hypothetical protein
VPSRFLDAGPSDRCTMLPTAMIPAKTRLKQFGSILLGGALARSWDMKGCCPNLSLPDGHVAYSQHE